MPIPFSFNVIIDNFIVVVYLPSHVLLFCNPKCVACQPPRPWHLLSLARILEWFPYSSPGDLPDPGAEPASPAFVGGFFITEPPGQPITDICCCCLVAKLFPILWLRDCSLPGSSGHEMSQTGILELGFSQQKDRTHISYASCIPYQLHLPYVLYH